MERTIAQRLAKFGHELKFEDVPKNVIEKAKLLVLDTVGICIGSATLDFGAAAIGLAAGWGGTPESSIIGNSRKVPAQSAAFCNGVLGHGQDYDDTHTESVVHPSAALVPPALALGERDRRSGRDVLAALVAGLEVSIRLGMPALNRFHLRGFHTTSICATFGAALMAAKTRGLTLEQVTQAIGIGGSFTSGLLECVPAASGAKRLHAGWAAHCGIVAADLARVGYTGPATVFEGKLGVFNSFLRGEALDLDVIFAGMGRVWETLNVRPKLYPCCHYLQAFIDCAAILRQKYRLTPGEIERIECRIAQGAVNMVCDPWPKKLDPKTGYDARFSLPFAVSVMLVRGKAGVAEFAEEAFSDPTIRDLMGKVSYTVDPAYLVKDMPGWVKITLKDGSSHVWEVPKVRGDDEHKIALEELLTKFHANSQHLDRKLADRVAERILAFEKLDELSNLMADLRSPSQGAAVA